MQSFISNRWFRVGITLWSSCIKIFYEIPWELTRSAVIIDGITTDEFEVNIGVSQGDLLAPYLFIVVIDWVMRNFNIDDLGFTTNKRQSSRILEKRVGDLEDADDIGLLENEKDKAQSNLMHFLAWLKKWG